MPAYSRHEQLAVPIAEWVGKNGYPNLSVEL